MAFDRAIYEITHAAVFNGIPQERISMRYES